MCVPRQLKYCVLFLSVMATSITESSESQQGVPNGHGSTTLEQWLDTVQAASNESEQAGNRARGQFLDWLHKQLRLDRSAAAADEPLAIAVAKDGTVYRGIFVRQSGARWYKYWKSRDDMEANPKGYLTISADHLEQQPRASAASAPQVAVTRDGTVLRGVFVLKGRYYQYWTSEREKNANPLGYTTVDPKQLQKLPTSATPPGKRIAATDHQVAVMKNGTVLRGVFVWKGRYYQYWKSEAEKKARPNAYMTVDAEAIETKPLSVPLSAGQVAIAQNGAVLTGVFVLTDSGRYYKYWKSEEERRDSPSGYVTLEPNRLLMKPQAVSPGSHADSCMTERRCLVANIEKKTAWQQFAEACSAIQRRMDADSSVEATASFSLTDQISLAQEIVRRWDEVGPILAESD